MRFRPKRLSKTGSMDSSIFSISNVAPSQITLSILSRYCFWPRRITLNWFPNLALIHLIPCNFTDCRIVSMSRVNDKLGSLEVNLSIAKVFYLRVYHKRPSFRIGENCSIFCWHPIVGKAFVVPSCNESIVRQHWHGINLLRTWNLRLYARMLFS